MEWEEGTLGGFVEDGARGQPKPKGAGTGGGPTSDVPHSDELVSSDHHHHPAHQGSRAATPFPSFHCYLYWSIESHALIINYCF